MVSTQAKSKKHKLLCNFIKVNHTSIATIAARFPERIVLENKKFCVKDSSMRSLVGLQKVVKDHCLSYLQTTGDCIEEVSFENNHLQMVDIKEIKDSFAQCKKINYNGNPLSNVNFEGAQLADTIHLLSSYSDSTISLDLETLRNIPPINIHVRAANISLQQTQELMSLLDETKRKNLFKRLCLGTASTLASTIGGGFLGCSLGLLVTCCVCALSVNPCVQVFAYVYQSPVIQGITYPEVVIAGSAAGISVAHHTFCTPAIYPNFLNAYKPHNIVFEQKEQGAYV